MKEMGKNCAECSTKVNELIKNKLDKKVTAVIPVKKTSTRCENKNIRNFSRTSLLKLKINTLKKVKNLEKIIISSDDESILKLADDMNVGGHRRDAKFCTNDNPGDFFANLAECIDTDIFMHVPCTTPFISSTEYEFAINFYLNNEYDSVNCATKFKEFLWSNKEPMNYDYDNPIASQDLPSFDILNFGFNIIEKSIVIKNKNVVGRNPHFIYKDSITGYDIDDQADFTIAELLKQNSLRSEKDVSNVYARKKHNHQIKLVDCTIRDGGYLNNWEFTIDQVIDCYKAVSSAKYDYFEIGFKSNPRYIMNKGLWCYCEESDIQQVVDSVKNGCKIAVMAKVGTFQISDFVKKENSNIDMVRVLLARATNTVNGMISKYDEKDIIESRKICNDLINLGYEVCMNFGCGDLVDSHEIELICKHFHDSKIKALYLADTYGGFDAVTTTSQLHKFYRELNKYNSNLQFGFHAHSNNENSLEKTEKAIYHGCTFIDSCIGGMGRGAGNLKSELFVIELIKNKKRKLNDLKDFLVYYDKHIMSKKEYNFNSHRPTYHPLYAIAGLLALHPDYIMQILKNEKTNIRQDFELIKKLDNYTKLNETRNYDKKLIDKLI
jgi:CMP-N-acetylneuraminic acid synthetase